MNKAYSLFFVTLCSLFSCNQELPDKTCRSDSYVFPSSDMYINFGHPEKVGVLQIPEETLKSMCTDALIETYLDYPLLFPTIFSNNSSTVGLTQVSEEFNGFAELFQRDDSGDLLLLKYISINPEDINNEEWTDLEKGSFRNNLRFIELTIGFEAIQNKLTHQQRVNAIRTGLQKLEIKESPTYSPYYFNDVSIWTNFYLITRMLEAEKYQPFMEYINNHEFFQYFLFAGFLNYCPSKSERLVIKQIIEDYLAN